MAPFPQNLLQLLSRTAQAAPYNGMTIYPAGSDVPKFMSYKELYTNATRLSSTIRNIPGTYRSSIVLVHLDNHHDNIQWLWSIIAADRVPAMSTPFTNDLDQRIKHLEHLRTVLNNPIVLTQKHLVSEFLDLPGLEIHTIEDLVDSTPTEKPPQSNGTLYSAYTKTPEDIAALMLTSGSTGHAKAVALRHGQMLRAINGKSQYHETTRSDVFLNWIGMDHVANLTEIHLHAMWLGANQVHVQAGDVIANPLTFLRLIDQHKVMYSFAPNFFLASVKKAVEVVLAETQVYEGLFDLSSIKALISGGEANSTALCASLTLLLEPMGAVPGFIRPGFGMTETCAGSIYNVECPMIDLAHDREFTSLGHCIPCMDMRVATVDGVVCEPGEIGQLEVRGENVFIEYFNNPEATAESFREGGWFVTGDLAFLDYAGRLNMVGRGKESLNINGVKYYPHEIEGAIEDSKLSGITPSFTAVFPHRLPGAATETLCVVYLPTYTIDDVTARATVRSEIRNIVMNHCMVRPHKIIPLERDFLPKTALGKLSRAKLRKAFEAGVYDASIKLDEELLSTLNAGPQQQPTTATEKIVQDVFCSVFEIPASEMGITANLFDLGCSSLEIFNVKWQLQNRSGLPDIVPVTTIISNPTVEALASALEPTGTNKKRKTYDPVVTLRTGGSKAPLWLIHPGVGEVLVFLHLARLITDRPVYALRARGFDGEPFFGSVEEMVETYRGAIQRVQPNGPYAIAGYSYGGTLGFEITKQLQADGFEVPFLALFDQPPHIKERMRHGGWADVLLTLARFFDLLPDKQTEDEVALQLRKATSGDSLSPEDRDALANMLLSHASVDRLRDFGLDKTRLATWTSLALNSHTIAKDYEPQGHVEHMEIFYGEPIAAVAPTKQAWRDGKLSKWRNFADEVQLHEVAGHHYTLLSPENVRSFYNTFQSRLDARGI